MWKPTGLRLSISYGQCGEQSKLNFGCTKTWQKMVDLKLLTQQYWLVAYNSWWKLVSSIFVWFDRGMIFVLKNTKFVDINVDSNLWVYKTSLSARKLVGEGYVLDRAFHPSEYFCLNLPPFFYIFVRDSSDSFPRELHGQCWSKSILQKKVKCGWTRIEVT